ncbi:TetR/AcrR family transcriptional regulator [Streptomyces sp. NPDC056529]|uniref:TetR/AcrR family transcriptional regulator n=1 Tax=Streptomyces sp. NPDC056529 TaxID=3345855 RepID=UPI0036BE4093
MSDRKAAILRAALTAFAERTVAATPVPVIAKRADTAAGTLYRYWPSKEALANAVYQECKQLFTEHLTRGTSVPADADEVAPAFRTMWANLVRFAHDHPDALAFLEHQQHAGYLDAASHEAAGRAEEPAVRLIEAGQEHGVFRDTDARLLITMVFGAFVGLTKASRAGSGLPRDAWGRAAQALWGLLATPASADALDTFDDLDDLDDLDDKEPS